MKVIFKYSKSLGNFSKDNQSEMHSSTAAILERKGYGKITKKAVSVKDSVNGLEVKFEELTKEDRVKLQLDSSLVKDKK